MKVLIILCSAVLLQVTSSNGQSCNYPVIAREVSEQDKEDILNFHNFNRNELASGKTEVMDGTLQPASNIQLMKWSDELTKVAQARTDICSINKMESETVDNKYGENMFESMTYGYGSRPTWIQVLTKWWNKKMSFPMEYVKPYVFGMDYGLFTQIAWATSKYVGCGMTSFAKSDGFYSSNNTIYVCNYLPSGNVISWFDFGPGPMTSSLYEIGQPCSSCTCDQKYTSLCQ